MIRFAKVDDIPKIMEFIDTYWKKGHILAKDRKLFEYEFLDGKKVNVVISENENGEIDGMEGFISYGKKNRYTFPVIWKVVRGNNPMLGIEILRFIMNNADTCCVASPGINSKTVGIYKYLKISTGVMQQWYRLNDMEYFVAKVADTNIPVVENETNSKLKKYKSFQELLDDFDFEEYYDKNPKPLKEEWYIKKRYFNHPIYQYEVYGIKTDNKVDAFVVFRIQECNGHSVLRLVDIVGNYGRIYTATDAIDNLMKQNNFEYIDLYEKGLIEDELRRAGWLPVKGSGNIIPNYFSPFVQEIIDINYMSQDPDIILFKADGDQDRPN